jgi:hypothetical protein
MLFILSSLPTTIFRCELMRRCWAHKASQRPSFGHIESWIAMMQLEPSTAQELFGDFQQSHVVPSGNSSHKVGTGGAPAQSRVLDTSEGSVAVARGPVGELLSINRQGLSHLRKLG